MYNFTSCMEQTCMCIITTHSPEESIESLSALVVVRVVPDDTDGRQETGEEGGDGRRLRGLELLAGLLEERDELETVLCSQLALL